MTVYICPTCHRAYTGWEALQTHRTTHDRRLHELDRVWYTS